MISPVSVTNGIEETDLHCTPCSGVSVSVPLGTVERSRRAREYVENESAIDTGPNMSNG